MLFGEGVASWARVKLSFGMGLSADTEVAASMVEGPPLSGHCSASDDPPPWVAYVQIAHYSPAE